MENFFKNTIEHLSIDSMHLISQWKILICLSLVIVEDFDSALQETETKCEL